MKRTGFSVFAAERRSLLAEAQPERSAGSILKLIGEQWRALDRTAKEGFEERASKGARAAPPLSAWCLPLGCARVCVCVYVCVCRSALSFWPSVCLSVCVSVCLSVEGNVR
eukprot:COSAG02_NODE_65_length_42645_cov_26.951934_4_plen_111_part_00